MVVDLLSAAEPSKVVIAMGYGIKLTPAQWGELDRVRFSTSSADVFPNCLIILISNSHDTIARQLGCGTDPFVHIRRLYCQGGVKAMVPRHSPGQPSRATPKVMATMKDAVQSDLNHTLIYCLPNYTAHI
jgi:hypothetical protein